MNISRESVFTTAVRSFLGVFFGVCGALIAIGVVFFLFGFLQTSVTPERVTVTIAENANWSKKMVSDTAPVILRIDMNGVIGVGKFKAKFIRAQLANAADRYARTHRLKGIFLLMNSPGGTASDSQEIYKMLVDFKKKFDVPVYTYIEGMCASGGMFIACASDKIYSSESGIIGSVGVRLGPVFGFSGLMQQYGVDAVTITEGKYKDMLNPTKPFDPQSYASLQASVKDEYELFVNTVSAARPRLSKSQLITNYGAQIYSPIKAKEYGYIDYDDATYSSALTALLKEKDIAADGEYQVVQIFTTSTLLKDLFEEESLLRKGKIVHTFSFPSYLDPELWNKMLYLYDPTAEGAASSS